MVVTADSRGECFRRLLDFVGVEGGEGEVCVTPAGNADPDARTNVRITKYVDGQLMTVRRPRVT
jgi:hypothetical protein